MSGGNRMISSTRVPGHTHMGASGYALSCVALIVDAVQGHRLLGHLLGIRHFLV
jgi:hypothetical protein